MRCRIPIIYLVDSAGREPAVSGRRLPRPVRRGRIFYYNSIMRRYLRIPQLAAVMGPCIAGGAYLPALSDVIVMVKGTSFMGLGGPNLVKGATGQTIDGETLGGAVTHTEVSGVAHYAAGRRRRRACRSCASWSSDAAVGRSRDATRSDRSEREDGAARRSECAGGDAGRRSTTCSRATIACRTTCTQLLRADRRRRRARRVPGAPRARDDLRRRAHRRASRSASSPTSAASIKGRAGEKPRFGGIVYAESAEKVAFFIDRCDRRAHSAAVRAGRVGLHGRPRGRARGHHPRGRALRRGDGDRARAQDRAHGEPRVGRRLLRDGGTGLRSRLHLHAGPPVAWR